jgi:hypothetical protein
MSSVSHIVDALACVAREVPAARVRMDMEFGARVVALVLDGEVTHLSLHGDVGDEPEIVVRTTIEALRRVLHGEEDVLDAIIADRLEIVGAPDDLIAAGDAMAWFLQGAVRCLSITPIAEALFSHQTGES